MSANTDNTRPPFDEVIQSITNYVFDYQITSSNAWLRARMVLLDAIGCAIESLPVCESFVGPVVKGTFVPNGFPLPGTPYVLDPLKACFDLGSLIRYLDHSDAYPGAEWGHPSDNIGAILPVADWMSRQGNENMTMKDVFEAIVKAYEIEGCFQVSLRNRIWIIVSYRFCSRLPMPSTKSVLTTSSWSRLQPPQLCRSCWV